MRELSVHEANRLHRQRYSEIESLPLKGKRTVLSRGTCGYPDALMSIPKPPDELYVVGDVDALQEGLAVIGARKATPYGLAAAKTFSSLAAARGVTIVSGGARGCDSAAHRAALGSEGKTVAVLGGGCDRLYPEENRALFQEIIDKGGAVISERHWNFPPLPYTFRARNRIIAGMSKATLIVEAGLPSGTFSTADDALEANKEVLVVPGAITSPTSRGANRLIYQGAVPIVDEETFEDVLNALFGCLRAQHMGNGKTDVSDPLLNALNANPLRLDDMIALDLEVDDAYSDKLTWLMVRIAELERDGLIARFPDGRYGPARI